MKIAVLIPCLNEEMTIAKVVAEFREQLPEADIYVYDNNSNDNTIEEAYKTGAIVRKEARQGKGNVIRSMFEHVDAEIYVLVDGDGTYPADKVHELIDPIISQAADMVSGSRLHDKSESVFRRLNLFGNKFFLVILNLMFNVKMTDLLSGYRTLNRRLVKSLPLFGKGFEIETEITLKALLNNFKILEIPINLSERPIGSSSKINIPRDGLRIIGTFFSVFKNYRPFMFHSLLGGVTIFTGLISELFFKINDTISVSLAFLYAGLIFLGPFIVRSIYRHLLASKIFIK